MGFHGRPFLGKKNPQQQTPVLRVFFGRFGAMLGQCWAHVGPMLGLCWTMLWLWGPCWGHLEPVLGLCWPYVGRKLGHMFQQAYLTKHVLFQLVFAKWPFTRHI